MDGAQLLDSLREQGLSIRAMGADALLVGPRAAITPELRATIREHKPVLLHRLRLEDLRAQWAGQPPEAR